MVTLPLLSVYFHKLRPQTDRQTPDKSPSWSPNAEEVKCASRNEEVRSQILIWDERHHIQLHTTSSLLNRLWNFLVFWKLQNFHFTNPCVFLRTKAPQNKHPDNSIGATKQYYHGVLTSVFRLNVKYGRVFWSCCSLPRAAVAKTAGSETVCAHTEGKQKLTTTVTVVQNRWGPEV